MLASTRFGGGRSVLACALAFLLVACGGSPSSDDAADAAPITPVTLDDAGDGSAPSRADAGRDAAGDAGGHPVETDASDSADAATVADGGADASDGEVAHDAADADVAHDAAADAADADVVHDAAADAHDGAIEDAAPDARDGATEDAADGGGAITVDAGHDAADAADGSDAAVDEDGDGVADHDDCAPHDPAAWRLLDGYPDSDRDGVGAGTAVPVCTGGALPAGFATVTGDCAPTDPGAFQLLAYSFRDTDGDGRSVVAPAGAHVCAGAALPPGYSDTAGDIDCDDTRAAVWAWLDGYPDTDGDGSGTSAVERLCTNGHLPAGYAAHDGDCEPADSSRWQLLTYAFRDADGDQHTVASAGSICSGSALPAGYATKASGDDCNDADPSVWSPQLLFPDTDGDGVGAGVAVSQCVALSPKGFATTGGDCAENDATRWVARAYSSRDADGDAHYRPETGTVCSGNALPAGYATGTSPADCDDTNPTIYDAVQLFADTDGDGIGAGPASNACIGSAPPAGFSLDGDDCAPADPARYWLTSYAFVDRDGDGATAPERGAVCSDGTLAPPYFAEANGLDCDDSAPALDHFGAAYVDGDADGFGAGRAIAKCMGSAMPAGYSRYGTDGDDGNASVTETLDDILDYAF